VVSDIYYPGRYLTIGLVKFGLSVAPPARREVWQHTQPPTYLSLLDPSPAAAAERAGILAPWPQLFPLESKMWTRIRKESQRYHLQMAPGPYCKLRWEEGSNILDGQLIGPDGSVFEGRLLNFRVHLENYPMEACRIVFDPPLYHVRCQSSGNFAYVFDKWSSVLMISTVLKVVMEMIANPLTHASTECWHRPNRMLARADEAMAALNQLAQEDPDTYMARAREHTETHHPLPPHWSATNHARFPAREQQHARFLLWVGRALAARFPGEEASLFDNWLERVMPVAIGRVPHPPLLTPEQEAGAAQQRLELVCEVTQEIYEEGLSRLYGWDPRARHKERSLLDTIGALGYARRWGEEEGRSMFSRTEEQEEGQAFLVQDPDFVYACTAEEIAQILDKIDTRTTDWSWPRCASKLIYQLWRLEARGLVRRLGSPTDEQLRWEPPPSVKAIPIPRLYEVLHSAGAQGIASSLWAVRGGVMNEAGTRVDFAGVGPLEPPPYLGEVLPQ
jgi:ubiquitin-protein ligase